MKEQPLSVFLMDDDAAVVRTLSAILERKGCDVTASTDPVAALSLFRTRPQRYRLVMTDLKMPVMTGEEFIAEVRKIRPDIPVVVCSGYLDEGAMKRLHALQVAEVVYKPVSIATLSGVLDRLFPERWPEKTGQGNAV
jgi:CheY-like chemotaxis protein